MKYLESRSKPEGHNGVFVELSPDVKNRHDQRNHQQLKTTLTSSEVFFFKA